MLKYPEDHEKVNEVDNTSELRRSTTIVYRRDHQALSTARFCRAGQLAAADTCLFHLGLVTSPRQQVPGTSVSGTDAEARKRYFSEELQLLFAEVPNWLSALRRERQN